MNYYEHHIGDYIKNTAHLSMLEDGAYRRLLDAYYTREGALPGNLKDCCKLARAATKPERDAVAYVLREFFELGDDGYHQGRCDAEIERYLEAEPEREAKRANERERQRRARERRRALFDLLREHGKTPAFDTKTSELEAMLSRVTNTTASRDSHAHVTRDNTATQSPVPTPQTPEPLAGVVVNSESEPRASAQPPPAAAIRPIGDWSPRPETVEFLRSPLHAVPEKFIAEQVGEFVTYWRDRNLPAASWDSKFIQRCAAEWKRHGASWSPKPEDTHALDHRNLSPAQHKLAAIRATTDYDAATDF